MAKKKIDGFVEDEVVVEEVKPSEVHADFGGEGLNALRDAVNWLLRR